MAKDRITVCKHYVCEEECKKGREAEYKGYCQRCDKYEPRVNEKHLNRKKEKLQQIKENDFDYES